MWVKGEFSVEKLLLSQTSSLDNCNGCDLSITYPHGSKKFTLYPHGIDSIIYVGF